MKFPSIVAAGILALSAVGSSALAGPSDDTAPYGKHLTSIEAVAQSRPGSFDVYIDPPTGFAFVHTPFGWTFTRKVPDAAMAAGEGAGDRGEAADGKAAAADSGKVARTTVTAQ